MLPDSLRFPIGPHEKPDQVTHEMLSHYISVIETFPQKLRAAIAHLPDAELDTRYRPEGWTIRQVVHHCADSHMNSLTRLKLALTEDNPTIRPYFEERWAELADSKKLPVAPALKMIEGIHERWAYLLLSLNDADFARTFVHPDHNDMIRVDEHCALYAWHCEHHLAHITSVSLKTA